MTFSTVAIKRAHVYMQASLEQSSKVQCHPSLSRPLKHGPYDAGALSGSTGRGAGAPRRNVSFRQHQKKYRVGRELAPRQTPQRLTLQAIPLAAGLTGGLLREAAVSGGPWPAVRKRLKSKPPSGLDPPQPNCVRGGLRMAGALMRV